MLACGWHKENFLQGPWGRAPLVNLVFKNLLNQICGLEFSKGHDSGYYAVKTLGRSLQGSRTTTGAWDWTPFGVFLAPLWLPYGV